MSRYYLLWPNVTPGPGLKVLSEGPGAWGVWSRTLGTPDDPKAPCYFQVRRNGRWVTKFVHPPQGGRAVELGPGRWVEVHDPPSSPGSDDRTP